MDNENEQVCNQTDKDLSDCENQNTTIFPESMPDAPEEDKNGHRWISTVLDYSEILVFAVGIVLVIFFMVGRLCIVSGNSMNQTLTNNDRVLVANFFYTPSRGDIVVISNTSEEYPQYNEALVKRVIAVAGDTLWIDYKAGIVYVNDEPVTIGEKFPDGSDSYVYLDAGIYTKRGDVTLPITIPEGYVFVMGDNRNNSLDSRYSPIGLVDSRTILGKVIFRIAPFGSIGPVS